MDKHTPGPWHYSETASKHGTQLVYDTSGKLVADAGRVHGRLVDVMQANALLIAAAPELLEALKLAAPHVCSVLCPSTKKTGTEWTHVETCKAITAALAKAEGNG